MKAHQTFINKVLADHSFTLGESDRLKVAVADLENRKDLLLAAPDGFENRSLVEEFSMIDHQIAFSVPKLARLESDLAAKATELDHACDSAFVAFHQTVTGIETAEREDFNKRIACHFDKGIAHKFFIGDPHSRSAIGARVAFEASTTYARILALRRAVMHADPVHAKQSPVVRANTILNAIAFLPQGADGLHNHKEPDARPVSS